MEKICVKCGKHLPINRFSKASGGNYLRTECKSCNSILAKVRKDLKQKHGSPDDSYICPICLRSASEIKKSGGNAYHWVIDHDHETDQFRGYLCHNCNRGLGIFRDNLETLKLAINYLENFKTNISSKLQENSPN
jgi:DNA-directed RNA polymerase subunit RPC12/RpoP